MKICAAFVLALASVAYATPSQSDGNKLYVNFQEVMIPMRDGVRLQTVILSPKGAKKALPMVLLRTPYGVPQQEDIEKGLPANSRSVYESYIAVVQNLRGRFKSEGKFVMQRPPHASDHPKGVDEMTDAWDRVEWLVHNVPNSNGRVGLHGISYDAWTAVLASLDPHPAVKVIVEQASPADMFLGDDFHHNGLFLQPDRKLAFHPPATDRNAECDEYVSDPANPVPYRPRPVTPTYPGPEWPVWLVQDQRFVDHRPDVLSYETEPLIADLRVAGDIVAKLFASTSGTDGDWVVKLIDVYAEHAPPDEQTRTNMGGYELIIADEIFRGRFRNSFEHPGMSG